MEFDKIIQNLPFALMFMFPAWAVFFALSMAFRRHEADGGAVPSAVSTAGTGRADGTGGGGAGGGTVNDSSFDREKKIALLRVFAINPRLFVPQGDVASAARALLESMKTVDAAGAAAAGSAGGGAAAVHGEAAGGASHGGSMPDVKAQAGLALLVSIAAVLYHFFLAQ